MRLTESEPTRTSQEADVRGAEALADAGRPATVHAFQWARALGALAIVVLHVFVTVHHACDHAALGAVRMTVENALAIALSRWAVPVFFMMSGALMLDPRRALPWDKVWRHVWRMLFVLLTFGLAFCVIEVALDYGTLTPRVVQIAFVNLLRGKSWDHLWFVYAMAGFYLLTPVLRPFVAQSSERELLLVVIAMVALLQGVNTLGMLMDTPLWMPLGLPVNLMWYVLGYYAHTYLSLDRRFMAAGLASLALMLGVRVAFDLSWVGLPEYLPIVPYALMVFLAFEAWLEIPTDRYPLIGLLSDYSFGIYLVHPVWQHVLVLLFDPARYPAVVVDVGLLIVSTALSIATIWILRLLPPFRDKV